MSSDLHDSAACFNYMCHQCRLSTCEHWCHQDQEFDVTGREWVLKEERKADVDA